MDALKLQSESEYPASGERSSQLASDQLMLRGELKNLQAQLEIVMRQKARLRITSPIDGKILSHSVERQLLGRPVQTGQILLTVAELEGPWKIETSVPDTLFGHVARAQANSKDPLPVRFVVAHSPRKTYVGVLKRLGLTTEMLDGQTPFVLCEISFSKEQLVPLRPGSTVVSNVICGKRPRWFVWFHEVGGEVRRRIF